MQIACIRMSHIALDTERARTPNLSDRPFALIDPDAKTVLAMSRMAELSGIRAGFRVESCQNLKRSGPLIGWVDTEVLDAATPVVENTSLFRRSGSGVLLSLELMRPCVAGCCAVRQLLSTRPATLDFSRHPKSTFGLPADFPLSTTVGHIEYH